MRCLKASTALAMAFGFGVGLSGLPVAAEEAEEMAGSAVCDRDGNGFISADEADWCAEREYTTLLGDADAMTEEEFDAAFPDASETQATFAQVDQDGDGEISQEEWVNWREQGFASAVDDVEQGMPATEYSTWSEGIETRDDETGGEDSAPGSAPN